MQPDTAMIFAAGLGTRMGSLTADKPKPMIEVDNKPLIDHALDLTTDSQVSRIVVNTHYLPDALEKHISHRKNVTVIREKPDLLETGGGLKNALPILGNGPVYTLNSDAVWTGSNPFRTLRKAWNPKKMDALLLLVPTERAQEHAGFGDFFLDPGGHLRRREQQEIAPFVYSGAQIIKTAALADISENIFSINVLWNTMLEKKTVFGTIHPGGWVDVGRPEGIAVARAELLRSANV